MGSQGIWKSATFAGFQGVLVSVALCELLTDCRPCPAELFEQTNTRTIRERLVDLYLRTDRPEQALEQMKPVIIWRERLLGEDHGDVKAQRHCYLAATAALEIRTTRKSPETPPTGHRHRPRTARTDDPTLRETQRLAADIHRQMSNSQAEAAQSPGSQP